MSELKTGINGTWTRRTALFTALAVTMFFVFCINRWSVAFPNSDDYSAILQPVVESIAAPETAAAHIFEPHTQHYQVLLRSVAWSTAIFFGELNFRLLIFLGSLFVFPLLLAFCLSTERSTALVALVCALLLCQPQYAEATQWATNAIPYLWINTFALLAFVFALRTRITFFCVGILAAVLALLSWGNGVLVALQLMIVLLFVRPMRALPFFFIAAAGFSMHFSNPNTASLSGSTLTHTREIVLYGVRVLGSSFGFLSAGGSLFSGAALLGLWAVLLQWAFRGKRWTVLGEPLFLFEVFLLGSCLLCGLARFLEGAETAYTTGRYTLPSILFVACLAVRLVGSADAAPDYRRWINTAVLILAFTWWGLAQHRYFDNYIVRAELLRDTRARWACFGDGLAGLGWRDLPPLHRAGEQAGVIALVPADECAQRLTTASLSQDSGGSSEPAVHQLDYLLQSREVVHASGYAFRTRDRTWDGSYALVLKSESKRFVAPLDSRVRPDVQYHMQFRAMQRKSPAPDYRRSGFSGFVDLRSLPPDRYEAFLQLRSDGRVSWTKLDTSIDLRSTATPKEAAD